MKKEDIEKKLKEQEKCLKDKDKRITTLEDRWDTIKTIFIGVVCIIIGVSYVVGCMFLNNFINSFLEWNRETITATVVLGLLEILAGIGIVAIIIFFGIIYGWWDD